MEAFGWVFKTALERAGPVSFELKIVQRCWPFGATRLFEAPGPKVFSIAIFKRDVQVSPSVPLCSRKQEHMIMIRKDCSGPLVSTCSSFSMHCWQIQAAGKFGLHHQACSLFR